MIVNLLLVYIYYTQGRGTLDDTPGSTAETTLTTSPYINPVDTEHPHTPVNSAVVKKLF